MQTKGGYHFGWNVGTMLKYAEIFALKEGVVYKNLVLNPNGGYVGIRTTSPSYPLQMGSGAYVSTGGVWTNASNPQLISHFTNDFELSLQKSQEP